MGPVSIISGMVTGVNHLDDRKQKGSSAAVRKKQQYLLVSVVFSFLLGIGLLMGAIYGSPGIATAESGSRTVCF